MVTGCATILRHGLFALTPRLLLLKGKGKLSASALFFRFFLFVYKMKPLLNGFDNAVCKCVAIFAEV